MQFQEGLQRGAVERHRHDQGHIEEGEKCRLIWYLSLLTGEEGSGPEPDIQTPVAELKERARISGAMLMQVAMNIEPELEIQVGEGEEREIIPAKIILLQAIHHAHEHRTQITTLIGQQGIEPPELSGWDYFDEEISPQQK